MVKAYYISTDKQLLDLAVIQKVISNAYWASGRTMREVEKTIESSYCFGMFTAEHEQIGFARVVTDYMYFGYVLDVIIVPEFQGVGYGKILIEYMLEDPMVKNLKTLALKTKDAHRLYERYGFNRIGDSALWMSIDRQILQ